MTDSIFDLVENALKSLSPSVAYACDRFLTPTGSALPDTFLTYLVVDGVGVQHADDVEKERRYRVQVSIWKRGGLSSLPDLDGAMAGQGFTRGPERQLEADMDTGHYGLAKDYFYL